MIVRKEEIKPGRVDIVSEENFIQCSMLNMEKGKTFKPHKHIWKERTRNVIAQESWVVIQGSVKCIFYDLDDTIIAEPILYPGDSSFTLEGGHNYLIMEDDTLVYEYKTGPYEGQAMDKTFLQ
jgi:cupin fold WbuC family metalloprotein